MGAMKQMMLEEMEKQVIKMKGRCWDCGEKLDKDELATGRDQCFSCYCEEQGD